MLDELKERIENAKAKPYRLLDRFHVGDAVYPFWLKNFIVYGIVIDVDRVARKIICDFNGVRRQFCPEDLMLVNPDLANRDTLGIRDASRTASAKETQLPPVSPDTDNGISARCRECGGEIAVAYDEQTATSDFVCTSCGRRISEKDLSRKTKKAMRMQLAAKEGKKNKNEKDDDSLYDMDAPSGDLDKDSYTHYVVLDRNGTIESGHPTLAKATKRMDDLVEQGVPCHVVAREELRLRPTDDTHWFRGIVASNRCLAQELISIANDVRNLKMNSF